MNNKSVFFGLTLLSATVLGTLKLTADVVFTTPASMTNAAYEGVSVEVQGAMLTLYGTNNVFGSLTLTNGAVLTHAAGDTNGLRLEVSGTLSVSADSMICVTGRGYAAGCMWGTNVVLSDVYIGGSYGGRGAVFDDKVPNGLYGDFRRPDELGGGGCGVGGGAGGGLVCLKALRLALDGNISANGNGGSVQRGAGGGAGGGVYLDVGVLAGAGRISACGGIQYRGGGGGRVALHYGSLEGFDPLDSVSVSGGDGVTAGEDGTVYVERRDGSGRLLLYRGGETNRTHGAAAWLPAGAAAYTNAVLVTGTNLTVEWRTDRIAPSDLTLTNGAVLAHAANTTNKASWLELEVSGTLAVSAGSAIDVSGRGYAAGYTWGTNAGSTGNAGGSYGGRGGTNTTSVSCNVYGDNKTPDDLGSGGGNGSNGGGETRITARSLVLNGTICANGSNSVNGAGSGGAIFLDVAELAGVGSICANGGKSSSYCGGGGGRIALYSTNYSSFATSAITALGGNGGGSANNGANGTIYITNALAPMRVMEVFPSGMLTNDVSVITLRFGSPIDPTSLDLSDLQLADDALSAYFFTNFVKTGSFYAQAFLSTALPPNRTYTLLIGPHIRSSFGQEMEAAYIHVFGIDRVPPAVPTVVNYSSSEINFVRVTSVTLSGNRDADSSVWINGAKVSSAGSTAWSGSVSLSSGTTNRLAVTARDPAGNSSEVLVVLVLCDTVAPTLTSPYSPSSGSITNLGVVTIKYSEALSGLDPTASWLQMRNGANQLVGGSTTFTTNSQMVFTPSIYLQDGKYTVSVALVDRCANSNSFTYSFTYDNTPPAAPVITNSVASPTSISTPLFAGTKETNTSVRINGVTKAILSPGTSWSAMCDGLAQGTNTLSFTAVDAAGNVSPATVVTIVYDNTAPARITPTVDENGNGTEVGLSWIGYDELAAGGDIAAYRVYKSATAFSHVADAALIGSTAAGVKMFTVSGLQRKTAVYFAVAAQDKTGLMISNVTCVSATPNDKIPPPDSTNLTFTCGATNLVLSWTPSANPDGDLAAYRLYRDGQASPVLSALTNGCRIDGLSASSSCSFRLTAVDADSNESTGLVAVGYTLLPNPTNLAAVAHDGYVTLSWDAVQPVSNVLHYAVYKSLAEFSNVSGLVSVATTTGLVANVTGLTNGSTNWFAVTTVNHSGGQDPQVAALASASHSDSDGPALTNLTWQGNALPDVVTNVGTFAVTALDESAVSRVEFRIGGTLLATVQSGSRYGAYWNVYNTTNDGLYTLEIKACDTLGNERVESQTVNLQAAAPAAPVLTAPADGAIVAKPSQVVEGSVGVGAATVAVYVNGAAAGSADVSLVSAFKIAVSLPEGTSTVWAVASNNRGLGGIASVSRTVVLDTSVPGAPTALTATPAADGKIRLAWFAPTAGAGVKSYVLYRSETAFTNAADAALIASGLTDAAYTDLPDNDSGTYYYRVCAVNIAGTAGPLSVLASATADGVSPSLVSIHVGSDGPSNTEERRFGPGTLTLTLTVSETLSATPFLVVIPSGGSPNTITLSAAGEKQYTGTMKVTSSTKSGLVGLSFSARDAVGNWGTSFDTNTCPFMIDTAGPQVSAMTVLPSSPINNSQSNALVQVTVEYPASDVPAATPVLTYTLSKSRTQAQSVVLQGVSGSTRAWVGQLTLPSSAGASGSETLAFQCSAVDDLGNVGTGSGAFQVYQGDLPPLAAPTGLTATSLPEGAVRLAWNAVDGAQRYALACGPSSNSVAAFAETTALAFTNTPASATNWYAAASVYTANGQTSTSAWCGAVCAIADSESPAAPTNLTLSAVGAGVGLAWDNTAVEPVTFRVYRSAQWFDSVVGLTPQSGGIAAAKATDASPLSGNAYYAVTAVDSAGNESALSECRIINVRLVPVNSLAVNVVDGGYPVLSWTHSGAGGANGCNVYVEDALAAAAQPIVGSFLDRGASGATRRYGVEVFSDSVTSAPPRTVTLPAIGFAPLAANTVNRGVMNRLWFSITNNSAFAVSNLTLHVEIGGKDHATPACVVPARSVTNLSVVVGGYAGLKDVEPATNRLSVSAETGETVDIRTTGWQAVGAAPLVAEIRNEEFVRGGAGKARFVLRNTSSEEVELVMAENGGASSEIRFLLQASDGTTLSQAAVQQALNGVVNVSGRSLARIPAGGEFTSGYTSINVPDLAGASLVLALEIDKIRWHTGYSDQLEIGGTTARTTVSLTDTAYTARALSATPSVSYGDTPVVISGIASNRTTGAAQPNAQVKVIVSTAGYDRQATVLTDTAGAWTYSFQPLSTEGGTYQACAVHPDVTAKPDQGVSFIINRLTVSPSSYTISAPRNYLQNVPLTVTARSGMSLTNLTVALVADDQPTKSLPVGISFTNLSTVAYLASGASGTLTFGISADNDSGASETVVVRVTGDGAPAGGWALITCACTFADAVPYLAFDTSYVQTGVAHGGSVVESLQLMNSGFAPAQNVSLSLSTTNGAAVPSWVKLSGTVSIDSLASGATSAVLIACSPDSDVAIGQYEFLLTAKADNTTASAIPVYVGVDDSGVGGATFKVTDLYTGTTNASGGLYEGVAGVTIRLVKDTGSMIVTNLITSSSGVAEVMGLPAGSYQILATANKHNDYSDRVWIKPGVIVNKDIWMDCQLVTVTWSVVPTSVQDKYEIILNTTFETQVPAAVVSISPALVQLPDMEQGDVYQGEFQISNYGLIEAETVSLTLPTTSDFSYELLADVPSVIGAGAVVSIPYRITRVTQSSSENGTGSQGCEAREVTYVSKYKCVNGKWLPAETSSYWLHGVCGNGIGAALTSSGGTYIQSSRGNGGGPVIGSVIKPVSGTGTAGNSPPCKDPCADAADPECCRRKNSARTESRVYLSTGKYYDDAVDLEVKAQGHAVRFSRSFDDTAWTFDLQADRLTWTTDWNNAGDLKMLHDEVTYTRQRGTYDARGSLSACPLETYGTLYYNNSSGDRIAVNYDNVTNLASAVLRGFTLIRKSGASAEYDTDGRLLSRTSRSGANLFFGYADSRLIGVFDHYTNQVLWVAYDGTNTLPSCVSDAAAGGRTVRYLYDASGLLTNAVDALGRTNSYVYAVQSDKAKRLVSKRLANGKSVAIGRDSYGRVTSVSDNAGNGKTFGYNYTSSTETYYSSVTTSDGKLTERWVDASGNITKETVNGEVLATTTETNAASFAADKTTYEYNGPYGEVTKSTDAAGTVTAYTYDSRGNLTAQVVASGTALAQETRYAYDAVGNRISQTVMGTNGQPYAVTLMAYDARGNVTQRVEAAGTAYARATSYTYDNMGNVLTQSDALGHTTVNRYDAVGRLLTTVNPLGVCTVSNVYNQAGYVETAWDAMGRRTDSLYDIKGHATNATVSLGGVVLSRTVASYDADGNLLSKTDDSGLTVRYAYDARGNPVKVVASDGRVWTAEYDAYGRLVKAVDPQTNATVVAYDPATGQKASVLDKGVLTFYAYNALAQLVCARVVAGGQTNTVTMTYDALGNLLSRTDAEGRTQRMVLDTLGRVTGMADALSQTNRVAYGLSGQVESLTDANGNRTGWAYDALGQLLAKTYDDGTRVAYAYDAAGRLASRLDAKGGYATYAYDALGNLTTNRFYAATNAASPARTVVYAYDALGRLVRCDDGVAVNTVAYDDAARTRTVTADYGDGHAMTSVYRYDPAAREMACDFGGATNVYRYDADGKLLAVSIPGEGWATYSYNALGQNDAITLPGGTVRSLAYDAFGRLAAQSAVDGGGNALLAQAYGRSLTGRLETKATDAGTWKYGYDLTDQVTNAVLSASASDGAWGYAYDAMGNRKTASALSASSGTSELSTYAANRLNQYSNITYQSNSLQPNSLSPAYDLNGNMTWDGTNAYFWDLQNLLVLVSNAEVQVASAYDAMGRRVRKIVSRRDAETQSWTVEETHHFFYDGWNVVRETVQLNSLTPPNALTNYYTWGNDLSGSLQGAGGVGGLLAVSVSTTNHEPSTSNTFYPLYDHNGNVERYVSRSGATVAAFQYDAFGNIVSETRTNSGTNELTNFSFAYRFSTKYWDEETGLYYYGCRFYRPGLGRWVNRDNIQERSGENIYMFVDNNGICLIDPDGRRAWNPETIDYGDGFILQIEGYMWGRASWDNSLPPTNPGATVGQPFYIAMAVIPCRNASGCYALKLKKAYGFAWAWYLSWYRYSKEHEMKHVNIFYKRFLRTKGYAVELEKKCYKTESTAKCWKSVAETIVPKLHYLRALQENLALDKITSVDIDDEENRTVTALQNAEQKCSEE